MTIAERNFSQAAAADLQLFAILHDREPRQEIIKALGTCPFQEQLSLFLQKPAGRSAVVAFDEAIAALPTPIEEDTLDTLASDYACVYLRYSYRASPTESVWFDKDGLERQAPMLNVRSWYRRYGLKVQDWAKRPEDHLVLQLSFLAFLLEKNEQGTLPDLRAAAQFLDQHLLCWIGPFADQLKKAEATPYFVALAGLTATYLDEMRDHLEILTGFARSTSETAEFKTDKAETLDDDEAQPFHPGMGPGW